MLLLCCVVDRNNKKRNLDSIVSRGKSVSRLRIDIIELKRKIFENRTIM